MSHTATRRGSRASRAAEQAEAEQQASTGTEQAEAQPEAQAEAPAPGTITTDMVQGFSVATEDFRATVTPVRARNDVQKAMDVVAANAYADWVKADRPSTWTKMPVITYFLAPEEVTPMRKLIRRAAEQVIPEGDATGARVRFGKEFVLAPEMAEKIGQADKAGKTVLAWAVIDKRVVSRGRNDSPDSDSGDD
jgi:hypothetical protein